MGPRKRPGANEQQFWYCQWFLGGRQPYDLLELHTKYGVSPAGEIL